MPDLLFRLPLPDADATARLGQRMAQLVRPGDVLLLEGQIGAGKTHFARSLIQTRLAALDRSEDIPSPTFTLVQVYDAAPEIWHADLYRVTHPDEAIELGLEEAFDTAICLIEWPDRLAELAPRKALTLRFELANAGASRCVSFLGDIDWAERLTDLRDA
ncbi:tRNA (adenosine(37)-N6)-threonylcarbamoyltransferase complex ATPase subunit type 1 TsaE [Sinirhodobacter sp. HNIBRBA609]|nr:tRNA (adenosine(37)-N6)-threonylcarbamoyltransferase complex ATPase subunit type 1 TsaE [Sinirhodobacter sp. HNIBRBA609]